MWKATPGPLWLLLLCVCLLYSGHFDNGFHFDDSHTVVENPAIRSWANWRRLLWDGTAFSVLPSNQGWRPLVSCSLALDYWLGGGLTPAAFHAGVFVAFLLLLWVFYQLARVVLDDAPAATLAAAIFGLHPVAAETVNYVIQRADLYVALGCSLSLFWLSRRRAYWLLGFCLAALSKPTALVFPLLVAVWVRWVQPSLRTRAIWQALGLALLFLCLHALLTPRTFRGGGVVAWQYWLTQPYVLCLQVRTFLWPDNLVADTDLKAFQAPAEVQSWLGLLGLAVLLTATGWTQQQTCLRPVAVGLAWYLITSLPTALLPLAEVTNDHRLFWPAMGLSLSLAHILRRLARQFAFLLLSVAWLLGLVPLTLERNRVWHDDLSLWRDVTQKSPANGRGWMNYGLALMQAGRLGEAETCLRKAVQLYPNYPLAHLNLGICFYARGRTAAAEQAFARAQQLSPENPDVYFFRARSRLRARNPEVQADLRRALQLRPDHGPALRLLAEVATTQQDWRTVLELAQAHPQAPELAGLAAQARAATQARLQQALQRLGRNPDADAYADASFAAWQARELDRAARLASEGVARFPADARLHNNLAAIRLDQRRYAEAASAARQALRLDPDFQLARNNLEWALRQQRE